MSAKGYEYERVGVHAHCGWYEGTADDGRPVQACADCGEAWVSTRNGLVLVEAGDGWCRTHGVPMSEAYDDDQREVGS